MEVEELRVILVEDFKRAEIEQSFYEKIAQTFTDYYALMHEIDSEERIIQIETYD